MRERKTGQEGLVATLRQALSGLAANSGNTGGPRIEVQVEGDERELPPQMENHLLRVALEAVTNAFKHASATTVWVRVDFKPTNVGLEISDDGKGFDSDHLPPPISGHFGLFGMNERAAKLNGTLTISGKSEGGTRIQLSAPTEGR